MTIKEKIEKKQKLVMQVGLHVIPELETITPSYSRLFQVNPNALASFAALILTEALLNGKIMLRKVDNE